MKLLNTESLNLLDITVALRPSKASPGRIPQYATLSHTRGEEEVGYADIQRLDHSDLSGLKKIVQACAIAGSQGLASEDGVKGFGRVADSREAG